MPLETPRDLGLQHLALLASVSCHFERPLSGQGFPLSEAIRALYHASRFQGLSSGGGMLREVSDLDRTWDPELDSGHESSDADPTMTSSECVTSPRPFGGASVKLNAEVVRLVLNLPEPFTPGLKARIHHSQPTHRVPGHLRAPLSQESSHNAPEAHQLLELCRL